MNVAWLPMEDEAFDFRGVSAISSQQGPGIEPWHDVLGVGSDCTNDEIKAAYRREMSAYHSDRVAVLGVKLREVAELQSKKINAAYERARSERGMAR